MKKIFLSLVGASSLALMSGCVSMDQHNRLKEHLNTEQQAAAALQAEAQRLEAENNRLRADNQRYEDQIKNMRSVADGAPAMDEDRMKAEILRIWGHNGNGGEGFDWVRQGNAVGVRMDDSGVLFQSGSWVLTQGTKDKLGKLAGIMKPQLEKESDVVARVDGHTDTDPIKSLAAKGIKDNTHLSAMRAMAVRDFLVERGLPRDRIFVAGFGEYWPVEGGKDTKSKQKNRRVEIYMGSPGDLSIGSLPGAVVSRK